jgi:hypothetical protein
VPTTFTSHLASSELRSVSPHAISDPPTPTEPMPKEQTNAVFEALGKGDIIRAESLLGQRPKGTLIDPALAQTLALMKEQSHEESQIRMLDNESPSSTPELKSMSSEKQEKLWDLLSQGSLQEAESLIRDIGDKITVEPAILEALAELKISKADDEHPSSMISIEKQLVTPQRALTENEQFHLDKLWDAISRQDMKLVEQHAKLLSENLSDVKENNAIFSAMLTLAEFKELNATKMDRARDFQESPFMPTPSQENLVFLEKLFERLSPEYKGKFSMYKAAKILKENFNLPSLLDIAIPTRSIFASASGDAVDKQTPAINKAFSHNQNDAHETMKGIFRDLKSATTIKQQNCSDTNKQGLRDLEINILGQIMRIPKLAKDEPTVDRWGRYLDSPFREAKNQLRLYAYTAGMPRPGGKPQIHVATKEMLDAKNELFEYMKPEHEDQLVALHDKLEDPGKKYFCIVYLPGKTRLGKSRLARLLGTSNGPATVIPPTLGTDDLFKIVGVSAVDQNIFKSPEETFLQNAVGRCFEQIHAKGVRTIVFEENHKIFPSQNKKGSALSKDEIAAAALNKFIFDEGIGSVETHIGPIKIEQTLEGVLFVVPTNSKDISAEMAGRAKTFLVFEKFDDAEIRNVFNIALKSAIERSSRVADAAGIRDLDTQIHQMCSPHAAFFEKQLLGHDDIDGSIIQQVADEVVSFVARNIKTGKEPILSGDKIGSKFSEILETKMKLKREREQTYAEPAAKTKDTN